MTPLTAACRRNSVKLVKILLDNGKAFLVRENIRQWLEQNGEFEQGMDLDNELSKFTDHDDKMFRFTQTHGKNLLSIICGKAVALQNLLLFAGKTFRRENLNSAEATITGKLDDGSLLNDLEFYVKSSGNVSNDKNLPALRTAINALKTKSMVNAAVFLNFYLNPQNYYCTFINDTSSPEKIIEASKEGLIIRLV